MSQPHDIIIVGAGLAGLGLALALHSHDIPCAVYEQSPASGRFAGAIMLSPNSLRILDSWGVYDRIANKGHSFSYVDFQDPKGQSLDHQYLGSKDLFGYDALRIYRNIILHELVSTAQERGIKIHYDKKLTRIVDETEESVTIEFQDGERRTSSQLIAADGIHSKIRSFIYPNVKPVYNGVLVVAGGVKRSDLDIPEGADLCHPITQASEAGAFILATQNPDGSELLAGTQRKFPEQDRAGWDRIAKDHAFQQSFLEEGLEHRSVLMRSAIKNVMDDSRYTWPQHTLPHLSKWTSEKGRIIIIGDAAHAIPPTSGQGANQAFEDGYALAMLLAKKAPNVSEADTLAYWQDLRQERVSRLLDLTRRINNMRLPVHEQAKLDKADLWESGGSAESLRWLYEPDIDRKILDWLDKYSDDV